ncbi:hypothetical protein PINS_up022681 [Pythium insidiosum]|nr:hypothetical protein PINS_up022681 [Pythium insidiosum]
MSSRDPERKPSDGRAISRQLQDRLDAAQERLDAASKREAQLQAQLQLKSKRIEESSTISTISLGLEIENQSICQHQHLMDCHERRLVLENEALADKLAAQRQALKASQANEQELQRTGCSAAGGKRGAT